MDDERQHLSELLQIYQRRLRGLEKQAATLGVYTPPYVQTEIEDIQAAIAQLETDLSQPALDRSAFPPQIAPAQGAAAHPPRQLPPTNNLPAPLTTLVGREREVAAACTLLRQSSIRLLTLTGPPGVGKTRLGLQVAAELRDTFTDGVIFVALEPIRDPDLVISTIAQALSMREVGSQPLIESLKIYLRDKQLLLLLDNCEQVVSAAPRVADVLATAPRLKVLATSRAVLHLSGERSFFVLPLPLPDPRALPSPDQLARSASVQLFIERAQAIQPEFQVTAANAAAVAAICIRLEGLPLAIELAAAHIRMLAPQAMLGRLASRLTLLTGGAHDLPAHQQTLRATIDWSYELLQPAEQVLFRRLAVFVGGHTLPAVEAICNAECDLALDILDGLQSLLDKSLLDQREGPDGEPRFMMLETIREYALERLAERGEAELLRRRHTSYYLRLSEEAEPKLHGAEQGVWLDRLEVEHDNLRAALAWSPSAQGNVEIRLQLAGALWPFWRLRGYLSEGRDWLTRLLALVQGSGVSASVQGKALHGAGTLASNQSDYAQALVLCRQSLALFRGINDKRGMALALDELGFVAQQQGDYERARALHEESLDLFRELEEKLGIAEALNLLGRVARDQGDYPRAATLYQESLVLFRELGDRGNIALALNSLGLIEWMKGDYAAARARFEHSLALCQELGDKSGIADTLNHLGLVAREQGDYAAARARFEHSLAVQREQGRTVGIASSLHDLGTVARQQGDYRQAHVLLEESLALFRTLGDKGGVALVVSNLGQLAQDEGDFRRAAGLYKESLDLYSELGNNHLIAWCLEELAGLAQARGQPEQAVRLSGAAGMLCEVASVPPPSTAEHTIAAARAQLGETTFAAAWAAGRAMTLEQAIAEALDDGN
jgi:predicted ATPase